ncbi:GNAT family N-acetyltransferase [Bacilliculturomica massiliensis]|uniref:GNAT family N-acetyltransferase n=1 Tax=Bacilliculturomica massiliensis TaxID=1917867 RepID=UPI0010314B3B|nr:GNAT family N-acetyltransferase [Bacilliculturomica massiliensis]
MKEREIRALTPDDLTDYTGLYLNAYPSGKDLSEACFDKYFKRSLQAMGEYPHVHFFGLFEEGTLIATMKLIDFDINLFGQMRKATGLMSLGVHTLHKKKGAARDMVRFFEKYTVESGTAVSVLLPFRIDFYRKLGYGCGTRLDEYHIQMEYLPENRNLSRLRMLSKSDMGKIVDCHREFVRRNHGALDKFEEEIRDMESDDEIRRIGYFEEGRLKGYAAFTYAGTSDHNYTLNMMDVKELIYHDQETLSALLGGLRLQNDLAQTVKIRSGEPDFFHLLRSPQDVSGNYIDFGFLQTNVSAVGTMYKIPEIRRFIEDTSHREFPPEDLTVGFCVRDENGEAEQRFAVGFAADDSRSRWSYAGSEKAFSEAEVHVACRLSDLSSLFMGSAEFGGLERLGVMKTDDPSYVGRLDLLFHARQKPFSNTDF